MSLTPRQYRSHILRNRGCPPMSQTQNFPCNFNQLPICNMYKYRHSKHKQLQQQELYSINTVETSLRGVSSHTEQLNSKQHLCLLPTIKWPTQHEKTVTVTQYSLKLICTRNPDICKSTSVVTDGDSSFVSDYNLNNMYLV